MSEVVLPAPGSFGAWLLAVRPKTLTAGVTPVLVGTAVAAALGPLRWERALLCLVGALLLQIASNLANDVFDHEKGADTAERLGPLRTAQAGLLTPRQLKRGLLVTLGLALLVGVALTALAGWPIVAIGLASMVAAVAYTGGPYPLGYHGLGDVFVFLFFGLIAVTGTTYVQTGQLEPYALLASLAVGALATNLLVVNNVRDRETDVKAGKRTVAVRFGREAALAQYSGLLLIAYLVPVAVLLLGYAGPIVLLPFATGSLAYRLDRRVRADEGRALNVSLARTAQLLFFHGALFALGIWLGAPPDLRAIDSQLRSRFQLSSTPGATPAGMSARP